MGCDIHAHIEVKVEGRWEHYSCPPIQRNYRLFARICGVRNSGNITPISDPRGLPTDLSLITQKCYNFMKCDAHSATWLSGKELDNLCDWADDPALGYLNGNGFDLRGDSTGHPASFEDCRFICWFDN